MNFTYHFHYILNWFILFIHFTIF